MSEHSGVVQDGHPGGFRLKCLVLRPLGVGFVFRRVYKSLPQGCRSGETTRRLDDMKINRLRGFASSCRRAGTSRARPGNRPWRRFGRHLNYQDSPIRISLAIRGGTLSWSNAPMELAATKREPSQSRPDQDERAWFRNCLELVYSTSVGPDGNVLACTAQYHARRSASR